MIDAIVYISKGNMFVIGMDTEKPVYYPITHIELKGLLEDTKTSWDNVSHHSSTETQDIAFPAENVMSAEVGE
jgi:hypothetical protein